MKIIVKRAVILLAITGIIISGIFVLNYLLVNDANSYTRIMMHEFYNQDGIDILFLGASQCYYGIDPAIISEATGKKAFVASSSTQYPDVSFAIIKEAIDLYDLEEIYLEISASMAQYEGVIRKNRELLIPVYLISDYMRPSINKFELLIGASSSEYYMNSFFPARRNGTAIFDKQYIKETLRAKGKIEYKTYSYDLGKSNEEWYGGKGYVAHKTQTAEHEYYSTEGFEPVDVEKISDDWNDTITEIINYCSDHHVKITLYNSPISNFNLSGFGNYDTYVNFVRDFVADKNTAYVDFNLLNEEYLPYKQTNYLLNDGHHLNMYGAEVLSNAIAKYINGGIEESAFYPTITAKLQDAPSDFYGLSYKDSADGQTRTIKLVSNRTGFYEYMILLYDNDGHVSQLQEYDTNNIIHIPLKKINEKGNGIVPHIYVIFREKGTDKPVGIVTF